MTAARKGATTYWEDRESTAAPRHEYASVAYLAIRQAYASLGRPAPRYDRRLEHAATDLAAHFGTEGPGREAIDFALRHQGIAEPYPRLMSAAIGARDTFGVRQAFRSVAPRMVSPDNEARIGIGVSSDADGGEHTLVVMYLPGWLDLDPIPRELPQGAVIELRGELDTDLFTKGRVVVNRPDGTIVSPHPLDPISAEDEAGEVSARVVIDSGPGVYDVEILADGARGPQVAALMRVYGGITAPTRVTVSRIPEAGETGSDAEIEREVFRLMNNARREAHLPPLAWDAKVANVARAHSADMARRDYVGHIAPDGTRPEQRVRAASLPDTIVRENVARAYSAAEIHGGLMASPGHRAVILDTHVTHAGVGVHPLHEEGQAPIFLATELLIRRAPPLDAAKASGDLLRIVNDARAARGQHPLQPDQTLATAAADACKRWVNGGLTNAAVGQELTKTLHKNAGLYGRTAILQTMVTSLDQMSSSDELMGSNLIAVGAGAAQGTHPVHGQGICVILILAEGAHGKRIP